MLRIKSNSTEYQLNRKGETNTERNCLRGLRNGKCWRSVPLVSTRHSFLVHRPSSSQVVDRRLFIF